MKKSCGSLASDSSECLVCDKGQDPDKCEEG